MNLKKYTVATIAAGSIAVGSAIAIPAFAAPSSPAPETSTSATVQEADTADRTAKRTERLEKALAGLVEKGTISQDQAKAVASHLADQLPNKGRPGKGHRVEAVAEALGFDADELKEAWKAGTTLKDFAASKGMEEATLVEKLVKERTERIDQAVADGKIDADRAAEMKEKVEERVTAMINGERPERGERGRHGHHGERGHGMKHRGGQGAEGAQLDGSNA